MQMLKGRADNYRMLRTEEDKLLTNQYVKEMLDKLGIRGWEAIDLYNVYCRMRE